MKRMSKTASVISAALLGLGVSAGAAAQGQEQEQQEQQEQEPQKQEQQKQQQQTQQQQKQQQQQQQKQQKQQQQKGQAPDVAVQATARGVITNVNYSDGIVRLRTGEGVETFRAMPNQIAELRVGEQYTAKWANFGGDRWLVENMQAKQQAQFGRSGQLTGNIVDLNKNEGTITLATGQGEQTVQLQSHPAVIEKLLPNQYVQVQFQRVGDTTWAQQVQPAQQQQSGQQ